MKRYNKYKDSNVAWLGEIPEHWDVDRAKNMFEKQSREVNASHDTITCFRDGVVTLRKNRRTTGFTESLKEIGYQGICKGDLVIHQMDAFAGAIGVSDSDGKSTPVYSVCIPKGKFNNYYYAHIIRKMALSGYIQSLYRGIRERSSDFRFETFARQYLPIPSKDEQEQIVRYLDWKVALADKFVEDKRREIELLKEYRQAVINKAVTKGLNPDVPMRDSGIDWIGDVPEHWEYNRFSHLFQFGKGLNITKQDLVEEGYPCLNYGDIHSKYGFEVVPERDKLRCIKTDDIRFSDKSKLRRGDFIFADTSEDFNGSGNFTYFNSDTCAYAGYHTVLLRPNRLIKDFRCFAYITDSLYVRTQIQNKVSGIKVFSVTKQILKSVFVFQPPLEEQQQIVSYLDTVSERVKKTIDGIEQQIKLVAEYKTSLISDVVTGKVDVREVSIPQQNS